MGDNWSSDGKIYPRSFWFDTGKYPAGTLLPESPQTNLRSEEYSPGGEALINYPMKPYAVLVLVLASGESSWDPPWEWVRYNGPYQFPGAEVFSKGYRFAVNNSGGPMEGV